MAHPERKDETMPKGSGRPYNLDKKAAAARKKAVGGKQKKKNRKELKEKAAELTKRANKGYARRRAAQKKVKKP